MPLVINGVMYAPYANRVVALESGLTQSAVIGPPGQHSIRPEAQRVEYPHLCRQRVAARPEYRRLAPDTSTFLFRP